MRLRKYTEDELFRAVEDSRSVRQALMKLGVDAYGGNYAVFRKAVEYYNVDTDHFTGQASNKGVNFGPKRPIEDYLTNKYGIATSKLRKRLLREEIFPRECGKCGEEEWLEQEIPLELHHINRDSKDNRVENLKILCPNCHTIEHRKEKKERLLTPKSSGTVQVGSLKNTVRDTVTNKLSDAEVRDSMKKLEHINFDTWGSTMKAAELLGCSHTKVRRIRKRYETMMKEKQNE